MRAAADGGGSSLAKLGRVLQEKAKADFDRVFQARNIFLAFLVASEASPPKTEKRRSVVF